MTAYVANSMATTIEKNDLFECGACGMFFTTEAKAGCETYDNDICVACHSNGECPNIGLCEIAGNW